MHINRYFAVPMAKFLPIMLALCSMLLYTHYAQNYAGIIDAGLHESDLYSQHVSGLIRFSMLYFRDIHE